MGYTTRNNGTNSTTTTHTNTNSNTATTSTTSEANTNGNATTAEDDTTSTILGDDGFFDEIMRLTEEDWNLTENFLGSNERSSASAAYCNAGALLSAIGTKVDGMVMENEETEGSNNDDGNVNGNGNGALEQSTVGSQIPDPTQLGGNSNTPRTTSSATTANPIHNDGNPTSTSSVLDTASLLSPL